MICSGCNKVMRIQSLTSINRTACDTRYEASLECSECCYSMTEYEFNILQYINTIVDKCNRVNRIH